MRLWRGELEERKREGETLASIVVLYEATCVLEVEIHEVSSSKDTLNKIRNISRILFHNKDTSE